jgi:hypothetical protein
MQENKLPCFSLFRINVLVPEMGMLQFWRMQMKPYHISQVVFLFVDGSTPCPSLHDLSSNLYVASTNFSAGPSQAFLTWKQQDQLILNALLSSISIDVLHLVFRGP